MRKAKKTELIIVVLSSLLLFYVSNKFAELYNSISGDMITKFNLAVDEILGFIKSTPSISTDRDILIVSVGVFLIIPLFYLYQLTASKKRKTDKEHGTAQWGTERDIKPFIDSKDPDNNIILSETEKLTLESKMKNSKYNRNKNVIVIGAAGTGKTRNVVKPNICQLNTSYVITDPKGELFAECGQMLQDNGYNIKVLNLEQMDKSDKFNLFNYIKKEKDILIAVDNLLLNTTSPESQGASKDDFWEKSEKALLYALFGYLLFEYPEEERNMNSVLKLLSIADAREDDEDYLSTLDVLFQELAVEKPDCFAVAQYNIYLKAPAITRKSINISVGVRLAPFTTEEVKNILNTDTIDLTLLGKEKTALFLIVPETYKTYNFIVCILYQVMLENLYELAKSKPNRRLEVPIQIIADEIANIGHIPNISSYISTMRSYGMSMMMIFQSMNQVEAMDKINWKTIITNCDSFVYLGGREQSTNEYVSKSLGKETIYQRNTSESKGAHGSWSLQDNSIGRELLDASEVEKMDNDECIVLISGVNPFKSKKYTLEKHKRFEQLADNTQTNFQFENIGQSYSEFFSDTGKTTEYINLDLVQEI